MNKFKILSKKYVNRKVDVKALKNTAVVLHLYYDFYFDEAKTYINNIPSEIDVYIVTANKKLERIAKKYSTNRTNIRIIYKINRGRDFAALLIACKDIVKKYKYVCFVHDKNARSDSNEGYTNRYRKLFYESTLCSKEYIFNIINEFERNKKIGLLSAPIPPEQLALEFRGISWFGNIDNVKIFLKKLNINYKFNIRNDSMTIGSVFWFRQKSLKQLINYNFKYSDFSSEPMPHDFTLAHSLERIVALVSEYNGYKNYYLLNDDYATSYFAKNEYYLSMSMKILRRSGLLKYDKNNGINLDKTFKNILKKDTDDLLAFVNRHENIMVVTDNDKWYDDFITLLKRRDIAVNKIVNTKDFSPSKLKKGFGTIVNTKNTIILNKIQNKDCYIYKGHE